MTTETITYPINTDSNVDVTSNVLPAGSYKGWRSNPNYLVTLYSNQYDPTGTPIATASNPNAIGTYVQAYIPEQFHFRIENEWQPFLSSLSNVTAGIEAINSFTNSIGVSLNFQFLSALIWTKTEPIGFSFTFMFDSKNSALQDVTTQVATLIGMASPVRGTDIQQDLLFSPGPTLYNPNNKLSMKVGRFFYCDSVVIDSMEITWYTAAEGSGDFIAADVEIQLRAWYTPDRNDILSYFGLGSNNTLQQFIKSVPQDYNKTTAPPVYSPPDPYSFFRSLFGS